MKSRTAFATPVLITETATLAALCARLAQQDFVTVDTEFMRERTYFPELCVIQLGGENDVAVIDAQAPGLDLAPLGTLLANPAVTKVFHACRQDVEIFLLKFGEVPTPIFDTQVAAMVAGFGDQVGYDTLVSALAGGAIDKAHRFSDWQARPLSPAQISYAAADVTWLRLVYQALCERLHRDGRLAWVAEEMGQLAEPGTYRTEPEDAWRRLKLRGANRRQLALVQAIAAWREREAARINIPRQRVIKDEQIPELAAIAPANADDLTRVRGLTKGFAEGKSGVSLLAVIAEAKTMPDGELPNLPSNHDSARPSPALVALLKVLLAERANAHHVAARLIASSDDIDRLAGDDNADLPCLTGWRATVFGDDALRLKSGKIALVARGKRVETIAI
ncbi:MAG TPA: ribonuclease D [Acidiphilium sp.]|nr:MAG: ribonuclease D [Acidiphilium sp. 21-60-14]OYV90391.1 MAG: ribonuclease D [Acidiphilium sp. 37-60-79]OZB40477.1 MAG: ribonuclease D [Acidiphilium sp. 34-60-192]HQT88935.1 ribonuclease D [Acidiphilium sp.]HQU24463.1 ribonuclease D [Acidiphilium sp.]